MSRFWRERNQRGSEDRKRGHCEKGRGRPGGPRSRAEAGHRLPCVLLPGFSLDYNQGHVVLCSGELNEAF
jgi:hypothetical protein